MNQRANSIMRSRLPARLIQSWSVSFRKRDLAGGAPRHQYLPPNSVWRDAGEVLREFGAHAEADDDEPPGPHGVGDAQHVFASRSSE